jgi:hypothetical protein
VVGWDLVKAHKCDTTPFSLYEGELCDMWMVLVLFFFNIFVPLEIQETLEKKQLSPPPKKMPDSRIRSGPLCSSCELEKIGPHDTVIP